jgi:Response regulators consisting of a CheY-like receiver domain and a winged-helix DNA-binding domain
MVKLNLEETGDYSVTVENKGRQALSAARSVKPDIVFLDIIMPDIDGPQVLKDFRDDPLFNKVPIVFLTALVSQSEVGERGAVIAGNAFLAKPVTTEQLVACIRENLRK